MKRAPDDAADANVPEPEEPEVVDTETTETEVVDEENAFDEAFDDEITAALDEDETPEGDNEVPIDGEDVPDEGKPVVEGEAGEPVEGAEKPKQPRDTESGRFLEVDKTKPAADAKATTTAAPAAAKPATDATAGTTTPWEPLTIKADKADVAIDEARVSRSNGHVFIAIPEAAYPRFQQRIGKGVVGERMSRQLDQGLRELEALRSAPPMKSDAEIEAALTYEVLKPIIGEFLDEKDIKILEANIKEAQRANREAYATEQSALMAKAAEVPWEETQVNLLANTIRDVIENVPELKALTREQLEDVYQNELLPVKNALVYQEGEQVFGNLEYIVARLKARLGAAAAPAAGNGKPAPSTTPAPAGTSKTTATKAVANAERFNAGVTAGQAARTTSVKANRETRSPARDTREPVTAGHRAKPQAHQIEDDVRRKNRNWLNSESLEYEADDE